MFAEQWVPQRGSAITTSGGISGFAPVTGTPSVAMPGAATKPAASTEGATNLFETILALVGAATATENAPAIPQLPTEARNAISFFTSGAAAVATEATTETTIAPVDPNAVVPSTQPTPPAAAEDVPDLLTGLADQLTALQDALDAGTPLDPATERKLGETIEAMAAALGIALPQNQPVDPAITAAASATPADALDPLATIEAAATAAVATTPTTRAADTQATPAPGAVLPAGGVSPIVVAAAPQAALPDDTVPTAAAAPSASAATVPAAEGDIAQPTPLPPLVQKFADKLTELAAALAPKAPELAKKLETLATKLTSGEIDTATLAKLGLDVTATTENGVTNELVDAIERLLTPGKDVKPAPTPAPFSTATLALPDLGGMKSAADDTTKPAATAPVNAPEPEPDIDLAAPAAKPTAASTDKPDATPARGAFQAAFEASLKDSAAPQTQTTPAPQASATPAAVVGTQVAADTRAIHAAYRAPVQQVNMPQMAVEIVRQVEAGNSRFQIRLDPPELGRIDVKLDVDKAGNVHARMTVERAETLDLMQRDQRSLEKALAQAGLDSSKTNLEFSLRQSPFGRDGQQQQQQGGHGQPGFPRFGIAEADDAVPAPHITAYRGYASASGVNLFV
jgi:flagellar hook-length control protein FliK